MQFLFQNEIG